MGTRASFFVFMTGLIFTGFGVGGVENSITNTELIASLGVAFCGLLMMWVGTWAFQTADYYDRTIDNPTLR